MSEEKILQVVNLYKYFEVRGSLGRNSRLHAVDNVTFDLHDRETLGVVGESGSGKSTLGRVLIRLLKATGGEVFYKGENILELKNSEFKKYRRELQMIFQDPYASLNPKLKVGAAITDPMLSCKAASSRAEAKSRTMEILEMVGLKGEMYDRYPHEFSGGQRQRISIARAIALNPRVLVCDEAVSALDVSVQAQILNLFNELKEQLGLTYIFIGHDLSVVKHVSDRILVMYLGEVVELASTQKIFEENCHPYTQALISAIPEPKIDSGKQRIILTGDVTNPIDPPDSCRFSGRCFKARDICKTRRPELIEMTPGHFVRCHFCKGAAKAEREVAEC